MHKLRSFRAATTATTGVKISGLPLAATLAADALYEISQDGVSLSATAAQLAGVIRSVANVLDFGAVADGTVEAGPAIQAAIASIAATGGDVFLPRGRYRLQAGPIVLPDNVTLLGEGRATVIQTLAVSADFEMIRALGTVAAAQSLGSDAAAGTKTLTVTGLVGVAAGAWLHLNSSLTTGATSQCQGEIVRVLSVAGDAIALYDPICDGYAVANGARIEPISPVSGAGVRSLKLLGPADTTFRTTGIAAELARDLTVEDVFFERTQYAGISLYNVWASRVATCHFKDIEKAGLAYGVSMGWACQDILMTGLVGERMRHLVTLGGGTSRRGIPRRVSTIGATAVNMMDAGFDCHPAGEDILFADCHVLGSLTDGYVIQCTSATVTNSTARNCGRHGLLLQPSTTRPYDVTVNGFRATGCPNGKGIALSTNALYGLGRSVKIKNVSASGCQSAIYINDNEAALVSGLDIDGVHADGCTNYDVVVAKVTGFAIRGLNLRSGVRGLVLTNSGNGVVSGLELEDAAAANYAIQCAAVTGTVFSAIKATGYDIGLLFDAACTGNTIDVSADFRACTTPTSLGAGLGNLTGVRSDDSRLASISISASYIEQRRTSNCFTVPITSGGTPLAVLVSGNMMAALAYSLVNGIFTKIAFCASTGAALTDLADFRLGVWDIVTAAYLAQTANEAANVVANTVMTFNLLTPVTLTEGQALLLTVGGVGTTQPVLRGAVMGSGQSGRLTLAGYKNCSLASGWAGGALPAPGSGATGGIPWIELMP